MADKVFIVRVNRVMWIYASFDVVVRAVASSAVGIEGMRSFWSSVRERGRKGLGGGETAYK